MNYIDLVLCKHDGNDKPFLFRAPEFSNLKTGARVIVDTKNGQDNVEVVHSVSVEPDEDGCIMLCKMAGVENAMDLKKVIAEVKYHKLDYSYGE
jgi:hypothetical protein